MRMSEIKGIGQYGEDVSVADWRQIPGQTSGLDAGHEELGGFFDDLVRKTNIVFSTAEKDLAMQVARAKKVGDRSLAQSLLANAGGSFLDKYRAAMKFQKKIIKKVGIGGLGQSDTEGTWASSLGQYSTPDEAIDGLATMDEDQALYGVHGLGQAFQWQQQAFRRQAAARKNALQRTQKGGFMQAIINTNKDLRRSVSAANAQKIAVARKNPLVAARVVQNAKLKTIPGTNVQKAIIGAFGKAAVAAKQAQSAKMQAAAAAKSGDKQKAAAKTVQFWQKARTAATLATKAEKTRLATAADKLAKTFESQARTLEMAAKKQIAKTGPSVLTDRLMAQAQNAKSNAAKMKAQSAVVAMQPNTPPGIPDNRRIADLANKFNIRTARKERMDQRSAMIAVLSDLSESALAQTDDFDGALSYYGADEAGKMMADIEYGNVNGMLAGLERVDGLGFLDDFLKNVKDVAGKVKGGFDAAKKGFETVKRTVKRVLPGSKPPKAAEPPKALPPPAPTPAAGGALAPSTPSMPSMPSTETSASSGGGMNKYLMYGGGALVLGILAFAIYSRRGSASAPAPIPA